VIIWQEPVYALSEFTSSGEPVYAFSQYCEEALVISSHNNIDGIATTGKFTKTYHQFLITSINSYRLISSMKISIN
jgi:hypothetical protein